MKQPSITLSRNVIAGIALLLATAYLPFAQAATLTWDSDTGTTGAQDGAGTWNYSNTNWTNGTSNISFTSGDDAIFGNGGTGGAITLDAGGITANTITFKPFTGTYTLQTGPLTLNAGLTMNAGAGAVTISSLVTLGRGAIMG